MAGFPESIMVIDDDPAILEVEELALQRVGNIVIKTCEDCGKALTAAREGFVPDLILLDLKMPDRDGTVAVREFRAYDRLARVTIVGALGVAMHDEYGVLGVIGVIHKPFKPSDLIMKIQKMWQTHCFGRAGEGKGKPENS